MHMMKKKKNKARYTALGASKHLYEDMRNGPTDKPTDGWTDPLIEVLRST